MANERQVSLDELAAMVAQGFTDLQEQITALSTDVATQFDGVESRFEHVESRFDSVESRFEHVESRFDRVERDLAEVKYLLTDVVRRDEFLELKQRVEVVERHIGLKSKDGP